jgi:hypothetical protein
MNSEIPHAEISGTLESHPTDILNNVDSVYVPDVITKEEVADAINNPSKEALEELLAEEKGVSKLYTPDGPINSMRLNAERFVSGGDRDLTAVKAAKDLVLSDYLYQKKYLDISLALERSYMDSDKPFEREVLGVGGASEAGEAKNRILRSVKAHAFINKVLPKDNMRVTPDELAKEQIIRLN